MQGVFPSIDEVDRSRFAIDMALPSPDLDYVMFFTPRSGSSWLTDAAIATGRLGDPSESFNLNFLPEMARAFNATDLREYRDVLVRRHQIGRIFGVQITHHDIAVVFGSDDRFLDLFHAPKAFWLTRRDIVAQAVSLYKMQATHVAHAPNLTDADIAQGDAQFRYSARDIEFWLRHILAAEMGTEALLARTGWPVLRMWYEENVALGSRSVVNHMGQHLGIGAVQHSATNDSIHRKVGTSKNDEFAARFRAEHPDLMIDVDTQRWPVLRGHQPYDAQIAAMSGQQHDA